MLLSVGKVCFHRVLLLCTAHKCGSDALSQQLDHSLWPLAFALVNLLIAPPPLLPPVSLSRWDCLGEGSFYHSHVVTQAFSFCCLNMPPSILLILYMTTPHPHRISALESQNIDVWCVYRKLDRCEKTSGQAVLMLSSIICRITCTHQKPCGAPHLHIFPKITHLLIHVYHTHEYGVNSAVSCEAIDLPWPCFWWKTIFTTEATKKLFCYPSCRKQLHGKNENPNPSFLMHL